jgi:hypothetical protein
MHRVLGVEHLELGELRARQGELAFVHLELSPGEPDLAFHRARAAEHVARALDRAARGVVLGERLVERLRRRDALGGELALAAVGGGREHRFCLGLAQLGLARRDVAMPGRVGERHLLALAGDLRLLHRDVLLLRGDACPDLGVVELRDDRAGGNRVALVERHVEDARRDLGAQHPLLAFDEARVVRRAVVAAQVDHGRDHGDRADRDRDDATPVQRALLVRRGRASPRDCRSSSSASPPSVKATMWSVASSTKPLG